MRKNILKIAIDSPAAPGAGTQAKLISKHINKISSKFYLRNYFKIKSINKIVKFMTTDKKNFDDKINLVLIKKIGKVDFNYKLSLKKIKNFFHNYFRTI